MLTDLTLHMMIPTYHMAKSSGCVSNELVWIVALASSSTIRNKSLFYQKNELSLSLTLGRIRAWGDSDVDDGTTQLCACELPLPARYC